MTEQATYLEILGVTKVSKKSIWNRIGTAFPTKDGKGYRLLMDYIPLSHATEIILFPPREKPAGDEGQ